MSAVVTVKYFNSYWLKSLVNSSNARIYGGLRWNPSGYPTFPNGGQTSVRNWIVEESRIRGGYNNTQEQYGVKAYLVEDNNEQSRLDNGIIYSGIYNSLTLLNDTNVFSVGEQITKSVDPYYGSIQKLHAIDSNIAIFQEDKVSRGLIDKDAIYTAEGSAAVTSTNLVIGQITPYVGEFGISNNPESFAYFGYRRYFVDKNRNAVMRLSRDGLTDISNYGMSDFFRDELFVLTNEFKPYTVDAVFNNSQSSAPSLGAVPPNAFITITAANTKIEPGMKFLIAGQDTGTTVIGVAANRTTIYLSEYPGAVPSDSALSFQKYVKDRIVGGYDIHNNHYTLSMQRALTTSTETANFSPMSLSVNPGNTQTLSFEDDINGWTSLFTYRPIFMDSLKNKFYSFYTSEVYEHYSAASNRTTFYGVYSDANITFIFNPNPSIVKNFKTVNYEGSNGWEIDSFESDFEGFDLVNTVQTQFQDSTAQIKSYDGGAYIQNGVPLRAGFNRKENKYYANLINNSLTRPGEVVYGKSVTGIKGYLATVKISTDGTTDVGNLKELFAVSSEFVKSS
jgi:hypothetical protein